MDSFPSLAGGARLAASHAAPRAAFDAYWSGTRRDVDAALEGLVAAETPDLRAVVSRALRGGRRIRPVLLRLFHDVLAPDGQEPASVARWMAAVELIHAGTLVHDDVMDGDEERRGSPVAHRQLAALLAARGLDAAVPRAPALSVLVGDYMLSLGVSLLDEPAAQRLAVRAVRDTWLGAWQECQGTATHREVASLKTGSFFRLACGLGAVAAGVPEEAGQAAAFGAHVGLGYQCLDDAADAPPGAPAPEVLRRFADEECREARRLAIGFPARGARDLLVAAPDALLGLGGPA